MGQSEKELALPAKQRTVDVGKNVTGHNVLSEMCLDWVAKWPIRILRVKQESQITCGLSNCRVGYRIAYLAYAVGPADQIGNHGAAVCPADPQNHKSAAMSGRGFNPLLR